MRKKIGQSVVFRRRAELRLEAFGEVGGVGESHAVHDFGHRQFPFPQQRGSLAQTQVSRARLLVNQSAKDRQRVAPLLRRLGFERIRRSPHSNHRENGKQIAYLSIHPCKDSAIPFTTYKTLPIFEIVYIVLRFRILLLENNPSFVYSTIP